VFFKAKSMSATVEPGPSSELRPRGGPRASVDAPSRPSRVAPTSFLTPVSPPSPDENEHPASRRRPSPPPAPAKCQVLLVEDDPTSANALRVLLTMHGCEVTIARSLEQGLDLLRTNPSAIVVDLMLPDGDGIEILARVREANLPIKVVVTTAVGDPARLAAVHRLKPECVLRKPIDLGELLRAIGMA
jgi:CheY-like chemotaxis protein